MRSDKELAEAIQHAMRERGLDRQSLATRLSISSVMVDKILSGEVIPSRYLENQMNEVLGIPSPTIRKIVERREQEEHEAKDRNEQEHPERKRVA